MTTPISGSTAAAPATTSTAKPGESGLGQDAFMKLLVAQLKYQNPMAPADGQSYMTQMATFTQVEKLAALVTAQTEATRWQQRLSAEGLVGREVTATLTGLDGTTTTGEVVTGTVTGVRFEPDGAVLELTGGRSVPVGAVTRSTSPSTAPGTTGTTPSTTPGTTGTTPGTTNDSTTGTTAA